MVSSAFPEDCWHCAVPVKSAAVQAKALPATPSARAPAAEATPRERTAKAVRRDMDTSSPNWKKPERLQPHGAHRRHPRNGRRARRRGHDMHAFPMSITHRLFTAQSCQFTPMPTMHLPTRGFDGPKGHESGKTPKPSPDNDSITAPVRPRSEREIDKAMYWLRSCTFPAPVPGPRKSAPPPRRRYGRRTSRVPCARPRRSP